MTTPSRQLRILSIVTLVSPLGEYGGPVRVAVNQANALRELGHDVTIAGGVRGYGRDVPTTINGVPARLFRASTLVPRTGFAGLAAPGLWRWFRRHARDYDVLHLHAARDLVTLPVGRLARRQGVPYVVQAHGMIDPSSNPLATPLDAVLTRAVLRGAAHVL
ncbi:MAG: glycosyltransferase, partial [Candidatus Limnocylindrales bacterium]